MSARVCLSISLFLSCLYVSRVGISAPINSNTAFAPYTGESIFRLQLRHANFGGDSTSAGRSLDVNSLTAVYVYGFTEKVSGIFAIPYVDKNMRLTDGMGTRVRRDSNGLGDLRTLVKYRVYTKDKPGRTNRLGLFAGVEWPTGNDDARDSLGRLPQPLQAGSGSFDSIFGGVWTTQTLGWELDLELGTKQNTAANSFEFGDVLFYNASYQHRLWPRTLPDNGVPSFVYGVIEVNGTYAGKNEMSGVSDPNSGGSTVFVSPGLQWVSRRWVVEASVQLPVIQNLNGTALEVDYAFTLGARVRF